jgi:hypothetical protein
MHGAGWKSLVTAAVLVLAGGIPVALGASIGVNYVDTGDGGVQDGTSDALAPAEVAGAPGYEQVNWNNLGRWGGGVGVKDSTGNASGVTVTWDSNNTWGIGIGTATPNNKLMNGYIDATGQPNRDSDVPYQFWWNENKPEVCAIGLSAWLAAQGATSYKVIVYTDGDTWDQGRKSEYWLQSPGDLNDPPQALGADLTSHVFAVDAANFDGTFSQIPLSANSVDAAAAGNYIVFSGLTADRFMLRTEERDYRATINGMQIVAVPEPTSIGLFLLAAMGLLARRRAA